jgi:hypothetical protein
MEIKGTHDPESPNILGIKALIYEVAFHKGESLVSAAHQTFTFRRDKASPHQPACGSVGGVEVVDGLLETIEKNLARNLGSEKLRGSKSRSGKNRFRSGGPRTLEPQETAFAVFEHMKTRASKSMHTLGETKPPRKDVHDAFQSLLLGIR